MSIKTIKEIHALQELGKRHAEVIAGLVAIVKPGVNTLELEELACKLIAKGGDEPAFKNYRPRGASRAYPCALCVAPNDVVVHGIPTELNYTLKDGDIIGLDVGLRRDGLVIDAGKTVPVGNIDKATQKLLETTYEALMRGIAEARAGNTVGDIGYAIETYVRKKGYGLVRDLCGHGVGHAVHEEPQVPNFGARGTGETLRAGMVLAIEPMVNEGKGAVDFLPDGYTVRTRDRSRSAHFEHNIVIVDGDPIILTSCW
ncbi:MAG: type I methionyl aminopeptidase [Candidatus Pacebacteria bacterium]|nr:type I methionyl aminopeptidase [Candidatus Paceibacterota bacterium]